MQPHQEELTKPAEIARLADYLETLPASEVLSWALETYGRELTQACGFGMEGAVLLHLHSELKSRPDAFYIDTGFLFPETLRTRDRLEQRYGMEFRRIEPLLDVDEQNRVFGRRLYDTAPSQCCWLRKVEPLRRALAGYRAWVSGIRRDQSPERAGVRVLEWDARFEIVKINPLAAWSEERVRAFVQEHRVPYNPMHDEGFPSIGCWPCTTYVRRGESARSGRWRGHSKSECGLHLHVGGAS